MKKWLLLLFLALTTVGGFSQSMEDEENIGELLKLYQRAVKMHDAAQAIEWLDEASLRYCRKLMSQVKTADYKQAKALPLFDRFVILTLRAHNTPENLRTLKFENFMRTFFQFDLTIKVEKLGQISMQGNQASAPKIVNGGATNRLRYFVKEPEGWRISIRCVMETHNDLLGKAASESGMKENDFLLAQVQKGAPAKLTNKIWDPPLKRK